MRLVAGCHLDMVARCAASRVTVYDVGPRDGLQNEPEILDVEVRAELVRRLADAGLQAIEVASFVDPRRVPQMAGAEEVVAAVGPGPRASSEPGSP